MPKALEIGSLSFREHGAELLPAAALAQLNDLKTVLADLPAAKAGVRINGLTDLRPYLAPGGPLSTLACRKLSANGKAVRAIVFDKTANMNWSSAWHQDRTICVRQRINVMGFGPWSIKTGLVHVAPPFELLARMVTLRVHLDDVSATNAPLRIALGSHRRGRVPVDQVQSVVAGCATIACLADAGDVWIYATPILHGSEAALRPARRRVLQIDFSADELPGELEWLGV